MSVKLQDPNPSATWTVKDSQIIANGDKETSYTLRALTKSVYREITRRHTRKVPNKATRSMQDETDNEAAADDLLDYALVDWSGVVANGMLVPCSTENKHLLDPQRQAAILDAAGINQIQEAPARKAESFREPADVV